ncbi:hypothetical protein AL036_20870 [Salipiger aestuarii]|nr:hypothetical protein C357_07916 [Citreicella sp. 357]KAA8605083.1 hypothetical protein AL036_20870 [Salipiger aestuarii]
MSATTAGGQRHVRGLASLAILGFAWFRTQSIPRVDLGLGRVPEWGRGFAPVLLHGAGGGMTETGDTAWVGWNSRWR